MKRFGNGARSTWHIMLSAVGKREQHRLSPYAVLFRKHAWYVIGHTERSNQILTFRINRIHSLFISLLPLHDPEDFSVQKYMEKSWDFRLGPETHVVIEFAHASRR